jgi:hypothetical protein
MHCFLKYKPGSRLESILIEFGRNDLPSKTISCVI